MNVIEIIKEVFDKAGFSDYSVKANEGDYPEIEYCVQYRESDLAFVSRLMEEFGLYTFYEHSRDKHDLILADSRSCHRTIPISCGLPFIPLAGHDRREREHLYEWAAERRFRTGKITLNDHDYMKPTADLKAESKGSERYEKIQLRVLRLSRALHRAGSRPELRQGAAGGGPGGRSTANTRPATRSAYFPAA